MPTVLLLSNTGTVYEGIGEKVKGNGWFGGNPLHSIQINTNKFLGRIFIQGTIVKDPKEEDWFDIWLTPTTPYLSFNGPVGEGITDTIIKNIKGNFTYLRAKFDRKNLFDYKPEDYVLPYLGSIDKIIMVR